MRNVIVHWTLGWSCYPSQNKKISVTQSWIIGVPTVNKYIEKWEWGVVSTAVGIVESNEDLTITLIISETCYENVSCEKTRGSNIIPYTIYKLEISSKIKPSVVRRIFI